MTAPEKRPFLFFTKGEERRLSQVQQGGLGFTSPILSSLFLLASPPPPPLPVGKEKVGGGGGPAGHRQHCGILSPQLLPADGGQDAIGSAFCVIWCLSLSNSEQERQEAMPPGSARVRTVSKEPLTLRETEGGGSGGGRKREQGEREGGLQRAV